MNHSQNREQAKPGRAHATGKGFASLRALPTRDAPGESSSKETADQAEGRDTHGSTGGIFQSGKVMNVKEETGTDPASRRYDNPGVDTRLGTEFFCSEGHYWGK